MKNHGHRKSGGSEILVAGERGIRSGAGRALAVRHVASLADIGVKRFAAGLAEFEARTGYATGRGGYRTLRQRPAVGEDERCSDDRGARAQRNMECSCWALQRHRLTS